MIFLHDAIYKLNSSVVTICNGIAYDSDGNEVVYDLDAAKAKLAEMQAAENAVKQAQIDAKESALSKLAKLGLTPDEIKALVG